MRNSFQVFTALTPGILTPGELQSIWIHWATSPGTIAFGHGEVLDENQVAEYFSDATFNVIGHAISTVGPNAWSTFTLDQTRGMSLKETLV